MVECLAPHLCGMSIGTVSPRGFRDLRLQLLLPAAAQLEQVADISTDPEDLIVLGHFCMLKQLQVNVRQSFKLTVLLPHLHTLHLRFCGTFLRECSLQCLFSQAPALRQLVLDYSLVTQYSEPESPWHRPSMSAQSWEMKAVVGLQCQQLDLLTVITTPLDEHSVKLLARIQCPLKLSIDVPGFCIFASWEGTTLFTLLAGLPNLSELHLTAPCEASNALWDQRGAILPYVQRLEVDYPALPLSDLQSLLQSIMSMCPALKHLSLYSLHPVPLAEKAHIQANFWAAFKSCAKLDSLKIR